MFQIHDFAEFSRLLKVAREVMPPPNQFALNKNFNYAYYFDSANLVGGGFFPVLQHLGIINNTRVSYFLMLDPDPIDDYFFHFKSYPAYTVSIEDSVQDYVHMLQTGPAASPGDAMGYIGNLFAIFPDNLSWFVAGNRHTEVGVVGSNAEIGEDLAFKDFMSEAEVKQYDEQTSHRRPLF